MARRSSTLLIADRNPHIREFLRREMAAEGYRIRLARTGREILTEIAPLHEDPGVDLIILDPDLPDAGEVPVLEALRTRAPRVPVIVHGWPLECNGDLPGPNRQVFVEKRGASVERLKALVEEILGKGLAPQNAADPGGRDQG